MRIPLSLIRFFIELKASPAEIGEALTLLGIEVDQIEGEIFTLSLTPNLGHCLSALGIARELSAAFQVPLSLPKFSVVRGKKKSPISVSIGNGCPRYMGQFIENTRIAPSPAWLQSILETAGIQPICNAVDITNYISLKYGHPLHAFDADRIEGSLIKVERADAPFHFIGLDEVEREIPQDTLLISDGKKPIALAGILGGLNSAIAESTSRIFLEAAYFDPMTIRRASKRLNLRTESAIRFEKGVDPNGIPAAFEEALSLFAELCQAKFPCEGIDLKAGDFPPKKILCRRARVNQVLGTKLSLNEMEEILKRLGFHCKSQPHEVLQVEIPTFRFDLSEEIDLVEEIARIYGYNNIEKRPALHISSSLPLDPSYVFEQKVRQISIGLGLQEFLTSDLISPKLAATALEIAAPHVSLLKALHAKTEEYSILRPSLLPGLLQTVRKNLDQKNRSIAAFEIGRIHFLQKEMPVELPMAAFLLTGDRDAPHWSEKEKQVDFYDLKGLLENLLEALRAVPHFEVAKHISFHPTRQANLFSGDLLIGSLGEIHPSLLAQFDIDQKVFFAEIHLAHLQKLQKSSARMHPLPQFPSSERDWTLSLPSQALIAPLLRAIEALHLPLLEKTELIDLYQPEGSSQKNATFRFTYRDPLKTISFDEVEKTHADLTRRVLNLQNESASE